MDKKDMEKEGVSVLRIGLRLHDGEKLPLEELLPITAKKGFQCVHMALGKSLKGVPNGPANLNPGYAGYLKRLFWDNGLDIAVLGNYLNLAHPDPAALRDIQERYYAHIRFAAYLGCAMVGTETGAPNPEYKFCPECRSDAALATFIKNFKPVVRCAEQYGVTIAIEPVAKHIVWNPQRCRQVLDEIGSHNLRVLFDPVNLLSMENLPRRDEVLAEAMEVLGPDIAMVHLKDYLPEDAGGQLKAAAPGHGGMDYTAVMRFLKAEKPYIYATLENTSPDNAEDCRKAMEAAYLEA